MNGVERQAGSRIEILRLDLLSGIGRQAGREYGVRIVPVTLLFDRRGQLIFRHTGLPDAKQILASIEDK